MKDKELSIDEQYYIVVMWDGDCRECYMHNGEYVHILHKAWRVLPTDSRIKRVKKL
jgi:hypothetical protein